jgi:hypothetical protein
MIQTHAERNVIMPYSSIILSKYDHRATWYPCAFRAAFGAVFFNAVIFPVAATAGIFDSLRFLPIQGGELTIGPVLIASALVPFFAFMAFAGLERKRGISYMTFRNAAWLAIALSLLLPLGFTRTIPQVVVLQITHIVVGACTLFEIRHWVELTRERAKSCSQPL